MANQSAGVQGATGARLEGASSERDAALAVQAMFNSIAPRYDWMNHLLSASVDRLWWARAAWRFRGVLADPHAAILDICCGTGDMTLALLRHRPSGGRPVLAADFAHEMLALGARKFAQANPAHGGAVALEADALHLPLRPESLDLITTAFGFRNLANYRAGLAEFNRVLRPGGQLGILDFSEPGGLFGQAYRVYFRRVLPALGRLFCGKNGAYGYLPASVSRFPPPDRMLDLMREAGFTEVRWTPYTFGIAGLYTGVRAANR